MKYKKGTHLLIVRSVNTGLGENTIEDKSDGDTTWYTDELGLHKISSGYREE